MVDEVFDRVSVVLTRDIIHINNQPITLLTFPPSAISSRFLSSLGLIGKGSQSRWRW